MSVFDNDLMKSQLTNCVFLNKSTVDDGYGGYKNEWHYGATFGAVIIEDTSTQAIVAGIERNTDFVGVKVRSDVPLEIGSVFVRIEDMKMFKIRKDGLKSPSISDMGFKTMNAESWELPSDETIVGGNANG